MKLEKSLLWCSRKMSAHALFSLLTLLVLTGLTVGLWSARPSAGTASTSSTASATRGSGAASLCSHVSVGFAGDLTLQQLGSLLRTEDAYILYGPDEFGEYHLRFASGIDPAQAIQALGLHSQIVRVNAHPQCQ